MLLEPSFLLTFGTLCVAGIVWAVRIEGRVTTHDRIFEEREKQQAARFDDLQDRLIRIENKLDRSDIRSELQGKTT